MRLSLLIGALFGYVQCGGASLSTNVIRNGKFQNPSLSQGWRFINSLPGWQINEVEQGIGSVYNSRWGKTVVIELDGNQNDFIRQKVDLDSGYYSIEFDYAARTDYAKSSALSVTWNGKRVQAIQAKDQQIHHISIPVQSRGRSNTLQIRGEGQSDTYGMAITNVQIQPLKNVQRYPNYDLSGQQWRVQKNQYFKNSDFEIPSITKGNAFLKQLPGWNIKQVQQGIGSIYNRRWGNKVVIELDANKNQALQQSLTLNKGVYRFEMNYAARQGYIGSAKFYLTLNDNAIQRISATDEELHKLFFAFEVNQPGQFVFKIHADGASDTFGMTIGQVSLYNVLGQVRRVEKDKEIICYDRK